VQLGFWPRADSKCRPRSSRYQFEAHHVYRFLAGAQMAALSVTSARLSACLLPPNRSSRCRIQGSRSCQSCCCVAVGLENAGFCGTPQNKTVVNRHPKASIMNCVLVTVGRRELAAVVPVDLHTMRSFCSHVGRGIGREARPRDAIPQQAINDGR
jgi:hypothetical protein